MTPIRQEQRIRRVIGLDAHPYVFTIAALSGTDARQAETEWVLDHQSMDRLEELIVQKVAPDEVIALEASGNSFSIVERLARCGRVAIVLESQSVGKVGKAYCSTDKHDAVKIARVFMSGLAHVVWTPDQKAAARRELFFAHRNSVKDSNRARNRLWAWFNAAGFPKPKGIRLSDKEALEKVLRLKHWTPCQKIILESIFSSFRQAEDQRRRFEAIIAEEVTSDPELLKLTRLLGIKHLVAFALAAFIGPIQRFATPKKLVAFFGLNPCVHRSGNSGGTGPLPHYGRADVRALLIQSAHSILRYGHGPTHRWALVLKMRKGASLTIAALARKLVVSVWYLLNGFFSPLTDIPATLAVKMHKIASLIGVQRIQSLGFESVAHFKKEKFKELLSTC